MRWLILLPLAAVLAAQAVAPEVRSTLKDRTHLGLALYHNGLALVRERREIHFPKGRFRLALADLSPKIRPKTPLLQSLDDYPLDLLEQNFEFDLLSPGSLIQMSLGQRVGIPREDGSHPLMGVLASLPVPSDIYPPPRSPMEAKLDPMPAVWRAARVYRGRWAKVPRVRKDPNVIVQTPDGFSSSSPEPLKFFALPGGLRSTPTLVEDLQSESPRMRLLELAYLTEGLSWEVHYVGVLDEAAKAMELQAMVTLTNDSGTAFPDATLQLIAGEPNLVPDPDPTLYDPDIARVDTTTTTTAASVAPSFQEETLADYHLYTLDRPTSLAAGQTKQIQLFRIGHLPYKAHFRADILESEFSGPLIRSEATASLKYLQESESFGTWMPLNVQAGIEWSNDPDHGLGRPLPQGIIDLFISNPGGTGIPVESLPFPATPSGQSIDLWPGPAHGWSGHRRLAEARLDRKGMLLTWEVECTLLRSEPADLSLRHLVEANWTLDRSEVPMDRPTSTQLRATLHFSPMESRRFTYVIRVPWSQAAVSDSSR